MRKRTVVFCLMLAAVFGLSVVDAWAAGKQTEKVDQSVTILDQIMAIPEKAIPPELLENAYGIAVIPSVIKVGFVLGGRYGTGILSIRQANGAWSDPCFISLTSGSLGWQIGASSTDVVLVFKSQRSIDGIMKGTFTLGGDASVAAGPVGRHAEGATDVELKAEIYSYSRSRGLFAGVSLEGSAIQIDGDSNAAFYGKEGTLPKDIFAGAVKAPAIADRLRQTLARYAPAPGK